MKKSLHKKLNHLLARKEKADALSLEEKKKWQKEIDKLNAQIANIQTQLGLTEEFDKEKILNDTLNELAYRYSFGKDSDLFWKNHPEHMDATAIAEQKVNAAFLSEDMLAFRDAIIEFKQAWGDAHEAYKKYYKNIKLQQRRLFDVRKNHYE